MILLAITAFALALLTGLTVVSTLWPRDRMLHQDLLLKCCLATGCGFGISSCYYLLWVLFAGSCGAPFWTFTAFETLSLGIILFALYKTRSISIEPQKTIDRIPSSKWTTLDMISALILAITALSAIASFAYISQIYPHGQWDAWGIWNRSARYLYRGVSYFAGESSWRNFFLRSSSLPNLDYPLLTPGTIAKIWTYLGKDLLAIPAIVGAIFTFATVGILYSSITILRTRTQGAIAAMFLLGTTVFTMQGASQYADVPLGFFIVSTMALFFLHDKIDDQKGKLLVLAGLLAGFAAWTKNEGILAFIIIIIARSITVPFFKRWAGFLKEQGLFIIGSLPGLLMTIFFKLRYAPPNAHISSVDAHLPVNAQPILEKLTDLSRYGYILNIYKKHILEFGSVYQLGSFKLSAIWILLAYLIVVGIKIDRREASNLLGTGFFVTALFTAYFFVYVTTHYDIKWLLDTSYNRLFIQLWPTTLLLFFLIARDPTTK
jgi:hypothetical protein